MNLKLTLFSLLIIFTHDICIGQSVIQSDTTTFEYLIGSNLDSLSNSNDFYREAYGVIGDDIKHLTNDYAVLVFEIRGKYLVVFVESDSENKTLSYIIKDQILINKSGDEYSIGIQMCSKNGQWDSSIFAVLKDENQDELDEVIKAWKYDYLYGQINSENIEGITCSRMFSVN